MLQKMTDVPSGIDGLKATGKLSKEDYENVFEPLLEQAQRGSSVTREQWA